MTLSSAPYSDQEWATTIFPAIAANHTLEKLDVTDCCGVGGGLVYDAVMELLHVNTHIYLNLDGTDLSLYEMRDKLIRKQAWKEPMED